MIRRASGPVGLGVAGSIALVAALWAPGAAWAAGGGQWTLAEGGTTCFNLLADTPATGPRIVGTRQALQEVMADREVAYVSSEAAGLAVGDVRQVVRNTGTMTHPATGGRAGGVLEVLGVVEVIDIDASNALLRVTGACREIEVGDVLRPMPQDDELPEGMPRLPVFDADRLVAPSDTDAFLVMGAVESVRAPEPQGVDERIGLTQQQMYAQRDLVVMDQGADSAWQSGDLAEVYRDRIYDSDLFRDAITVPPLLGRGIVVHADANSAVVQLVDSVAEIQVGDRARKAGSIWDYVNHPPTINCVSERATVRYGESVRLSAQVSDEDGDATVVGWRAGDGTLSATEGTSVTWTADALDPSTRDRGAIEIIATADDGRDEGLVSCIVPLTVAPPPAGGAPVPPGAEVLDFVCPEFPLGVTAVDNRCKAVLDDVALRMRQDPRATAEIVGHTDSTGSDETNLATSQARADAARTYLVETHGIDAARLTSAGIGSAEPIADNDTPEGQLINRRVTIRVVLPGGDGQER